MDAVILEQLQNARQPSGTIYILGVLYFAYPNLTPPLWHATRYCSVYTEGLREGRGTLQCSTGHEEHVGVT